jgi:hypothetical protein
MREDIQGELKSFGYGPHLLKAALRELPKKMWCYRSRQDRWSIHDLIVHLAESEASLYLCSRQFIADPGSAVIEFDSRCGDRSLVDFHQSARESLKIISLLRKATYLLLCALPDHVWENSLIHRHNGSITLHRWMVVQRGHIPIRINQMQDIYSDWIKTHAPRQRVMSSGW